MCLKERNAKRYAEKRDHILAVCRVYRENNPVKRIDTKARSFQKHKSKHLDYQRERRRQRPDIVSAQNAARSARRRGAAVCDFTKAQWEQMLVDTGGKCHYCRRDDRPMTQDHVIPLSRGGNHTQSNIVPACRSCNSRKHDKEVQTVIFTQMEAA